MVEFLVENGADIEAQDNEGWTALHAAASCGFEEIASYLIESGANIISCNNEGELPLDLAEEEDMEEFLQDEMDKLGVDVETARSEEEEKMLEDAKQWLNSKVIKERRHPKTGATALHVASAKGYIKVMNILIQAGVDVNAKDNDGWTPLHAASHWGHKEACEVLVEGMCDMDAKNKLSQTAFDLADDEILKWLEELKKKQASDKKTMESSSSSEESGSEEESSSEEEEEEEEKNSDKNQSAARRSGEVNSRLGRPTITPQPASPAKREMPSFSPKPLAPQPAQPKKEEKQEEVPAWRTGLRKTTSSSVVPEPKKTETQADKLARSASTPRIPTSKPETKPPAPWENQRVGRTTTPTTKPSDPEPSREVVLPSPRGSGRRRIAAEITTEQDKAETTRDRSARDRNTLSGASTPSTTTLSTTDTTTTTTNNNTPVGSSATTTVPITRRANIMTPGKDEESETQRKARAKRERSTRRSTQGVSAEDLESAVSTLKSSEQPQDNRVADSNKQDPPRLRPRIATATVENKEEKSKKDESTPVTFVARPSRSAPQDSSSTSSATARLGRYGRDDKSATDEAKEKERAREKEKELDTSLRKNNSGTAISRRRPREKRRATGVIYLEEEEDDDDDEEEEEEEPLKGRRPSPLYSSYTSDRSTRPSSTSSVGSRYGDSSSSVLDRSRGGSERNQVSSRASSAQPCPSCKKLFEEKETLISKLQGQVQQKDQEIAELRSQSDRRSDSRAGDSDRRERRGLERRISELEEEVKAMEQLRSDNQRLKDENGALVRVISKLSK
ncbi:protein phosphatase 1 regulatory subunit 12A-like isoform X8 [Diadema antillarum]|uniref:protein phosphatase 1 regulatory subunit 12A-like isoform X8 n=1 Tax=Diadema antillarum TaxID=105358 RepID=UPI003A8971B0